MGTMLALERSLLRGFLSAAESLEWKQGEVAAAGEGRSRPGGGKVPGRCYGYSEPPTSPPAPGRARAAAGGSLHRRPLRGRSCPPLPPFLPFARLWGAPAGAAGRGRPVGLVRPEGRERHCRQG